MTAAKKGLRDQILKAGRNVGRHEYKVEEWDGVTIWLHEMSVEDAQQFSALARDVDEGGEEAVKENFDASVDMLIRSIRDESGERVFTEDDRAFLMGQPVRLVTKLMRTLMEASGVGERAEEQAKNG